MENINNNISVCLATYNGEKYIKEQIDSILPELEQGDELLILDDCSNDNTVNLINSYLFDDRIKLILNRTNLGHVQTFNKLIYLAKNEYIFLSDQDDIWIEKRVFYLKNSLKKSEALLVSSNTIFIDSKGNIIEYTTDGVNSKYSNYYYKNIIDIFIGKENYYGCAMAFKKELKELILPIPHYVESHDLWIAMAANIMNSNLHYDNATLKRRVHGENASIVSRDLYLKLWSRVLFIRSMFHLIIRKLILWLIK